eukprot:2630794-Heterocapsa_arctica.AAC.1
MSMLLDQHNMLYNNQVGGKNYIVLHTKQEITHVDINIDSGGDDSCYALGDHGTFGAGNCNRLYWSGVQHDKHIYAQILLAQTHRKGRPDQAKLQIPSGTQMAMN